MSAVLNITVNGVTVPAHAEYTHVDLANIYEILLNPIAIAFQRNQGDPPTATDIANVEQALVDLQNFVQNGVLVDGSGVALLSGTGLATTYTTTPTVFLDGSVQGPKTFFFTVEMGRAIDNINRSLTAADFFSAGTTVEKLEALQNWIDAGDVAVTEIMFNAANAIDSNRSLQAMIEAEYVRAGNDLIFEKLTTLRDAISINKDVLETLERVQEFHNRIAPEVRDPSDEFEDYIESGTDYGSVEAIVSDYTTGTSTTFIPSPFNMTITAFQGDNVETFFDDPLTPVVDMDPLTAGNQPITGAHELEFGALRDQLQQHIDDLAAQGATGAGTLHERLTTLLDTMQPGTPPDTVLITSWIVDNRGSTDVPTVGTIQKNITESINSAENLNDEQKEELRRFMFVFEEFYKSASAMLSTISRIIEKMGSGIAR